MTRTDRLLTIAISAHAAQVATHTLARLWRCSAAAQVDAVTADYSARQAWADLAAAVKRKAR